MERLAEKAKTISNVYFIETKQPTPHNENRPLHSIYLGSGPKLEWRQHINRGFIMGQCGVTFSHRAALFLSPQLGPGWEPAAFQPCLQHCTGQHTPISVRSLSLGKLQREISISHANIKSLKSEGKKHKTPNITPKNLTPLVLPEEYVRDNYHIRELLKCLEKGMHLKKKEK